MSFTYHIHRTVAALPDVNSIPMNLPLAGFYSIWAADKFLDDNPDALNYLHIVNASNGKIMRTVKPRLNPACA